MTPGQTRPEEEEGGGHRAKCALEEKDALSNAPWGERGQGHQVQGRSSASWRRRVPCRLGPNLLDTTVVKLLFHVSALPM